MSAHREGSVPTLRVFYLERDAAWYWIETDECGVDVGVQHGPFDTALLAGSDARAAVIKHHEDTNMNTPADASDTAINRLFGDELPRPKIVPCSTDHPLAAWLFRQFKPGGDILTKPKAYELGNELNRLLDRVEELERRLGLPQGRDESDEDAAP